MTIPIYDLDGSGAGLSDVGLDPPVGDVISALSQVDYNPQPGVVSGRISWSVPPEVDTAYISHYVVYMAEGPDMKEEMMDQLRDWYIKYRERQGEVPQFPPEEEEEPTAEELAAQAAAAAGGGQDAKGGKDAGKKGKGGEEVEAPPPPPAYFVDALQDTFQEWTDKWQHRDDTNNFAQKHDVHLVKQMVRPEVETRVRDEVNALIEKELNNLKEAYDRDMKAKKAKGAKKGKKGKGKKGARACPFFSPATPSQPLPAAACRCLPPSLPHPCLPTSHPSPHLLPTSS